MSEEKDFRVFTNGNVFYCGQAAYDEIVANSSIRFHAGRELLVSSTMFEGKNICGVQIVNASDNQLATLEWSAKQAEKLSTEQA
jgi:hypothetical protein